MLDKTQVARYLETKKLVVTFGDSRTGDHVELRLTPNEVEALSNFLLPEVEVTCHDPAFLGWTAEMVVENVADSDWEDAFNAGDWDKITAKIA